MQGPHSFPTAFRMTGSNRHPRAIQFRAVCFLHQVCILHLHFYLCHLQRSVTSVIDVLRKLYHVGGSSVRKWSP